MVATVVSRVRVGAPDPAPPLPMPVDAPRALPGRLRYAWLLGLLVAIVATLPVWASPARTFVGMKGDPEQYAWFLSWTLHALQHGLNPFETHLTNVPWGANLMWNTWEPLAGLVLSPVTLLFGPILSYNLLMAGCLALNVPAAFALTRRVTRDGRAALVGALAFGLSPFVAIHGLMHADFALGAYPPIALSILFDAGTGRRSPRRVGVLLGAATIAQLLLGEEILAIFAVGVCLLGAYLILAERTWLRQAASRLARTLIIAAAVALPAAAIPLMWQLLGPQRVAEAMFSSTVYSVDLAGLFVASPAALVHTPMAFIASGWSGYLPESTAFVLPLIVVLALLHRSWWPSRLARAALATSCAALFLACGPTLHVAGALTGIPGPGRLLAHVPLLDKSLPERLTLLVDLGGAVLVAIALGGARHRLEQPFRSLPVKALLAVAAVLWLPAWPMAAYAPQQVLGIRNPAVLRAGDVVEFAPTTSVGYSSSPMLWQAEDSFRWSMHSGYLMSPQGVPRLHGHPSDFPCLDGATYFPPHAGILNVACPSDLAHLLRAAGITILVMPPSPWEGWLAPRITSVLGRPQMRGGLAVWRLAPPA